MKSIKRYIPEKSFSIIEEQYDSDPLMFKSEKEVIYFILDCFYRLKTFNKHVYSHDSEYMTISSKYFRSYISKNYSNYLTWMVKHKLIICDRIKKTGKAYGYNLHPDIKSKLIAVQISKDCIITKRIIDNYNRKYKIHKKTDEHILIMKNHLKKSLKINLNEALQWLEYQFESFNINIDQYNAYFISVQCIENKEFYFNINSTNGRLDTNITNLKSELRQFLKGDYCHIDCKNSQPLLLNYILDYLLFIFNNINIKSPSSPTLPPSLGTEYEKTLLKELSNSDLEWLNFFPLNDEVIGEFKRYRNDTFKSDFYDNLKIEYENLYKRKILRKDMKELLYKVFFSENKAYKKEKKLFNTKYPNISKIIFKLKNERHNKLALCLQRIESDLFIKKISKRLVESNIIPFTIHDSILVLNKDRDETIKIMQEVYKEVLNGVPELECTTL